MTTNRREFLATASATAAAAMLGPALLARAAGKAPQSLDVLVLGGTGFLGPHLIHVLLERGHNVTMFNRGQTEPRIFVEQFGEVEALHGDRKEDLSALGTDRKWDAVIDTSAYYPRVVDMSAGLLKDRVKHYTLISTISVYGQRNSIDMDETAEVATIEDETTEVVNGLTYGALKALCEQKAEEIMPGRVANIRPGLIVGRGDPTDRYTYWVDRINKGGRVIAPGSGDDYTQIIDVRDLAEWNIRVLENNTTGVFNAVTPPRAWTMRSMLDGVNQVCGNRAELVWVDADFLMENQIQPWQHMTAWVPPSIEGYEGFGQLSTKRATDAGLTCRSETETAQDTLDWWMSLPEDRRATLGAGVSDETHKTVLEAWDARES